MIKILGDSFCDIITSNLSAFPRVGGDALAAIRLTAGGSALNTALHGAHFALTILDGNVAFEALTAVGNDYQVLFAAIFLQYCNFILYYLCLSFTHSVHHAQGSICSEAMNHPLLKQSVCKDHGYSTGTCIVLSHGGDRSFITDRGCVDRMSLQWFGGIDAVLQNCAAIHIAGYYNLGLLRQELIELCRQVLYYAIVCL
jgi:sugar/nucleoside kinase (ribokinase family)